MHRSVRTTLALFALTVAILATGCATLVPSSDSTPPEVSMAVIGAGPTFTLTPTSANAVRVVSTGDKVTLFASAIDEQGVKDVSISGSMDMHCTKPGRSVRTFVHYRADNPEDPSVGVGDRTVDRRLTRLEIDTGGLLNLCSNGFTLRSASGTFRARGENFHGGVTTTASFTLAFP
jgi:hypothetical protein